MKSKSQMFALSCLVLGSLLAAKNVLAQTSYQKSNGTTIITGPGGTVIQGPNGTFVMTNNTSDSLSGTWSEGVNLSINQVMRGMTIPDKIVIKDFELKMNDGTSMKLLALTGDENRLNDQAKWAVVWKRAQIVCDFTKTHRHIYAISTGAKWFSGMLLDVSQTRMDDTTPVYTTYAAGNFSGTKYFDKVVCGSIPRGY